MTNQERNRAILKLSKDYLNWADSKEWTEASEAEKQRLKAELSRLYHAGDLETLSRRSILIMIRINVSLRAIQFHLFGIGINV